MDAYKIIQRLLALMLALTLLWLLLLIAVLIKLDSKGPVFFTQTRVGHKKKRFTLFKFRTMRDGAERERKELEERNEVEAPTFKIFGDPRVTKFGRILRTTNLDELPQLLNIIFGDMYFVGFRPPTPDEVEKYEPWMMERFQKTPGITSTWAVSGMHDIAFADWIKMDINYVNTPLNDLEIAAKTILLILEKMVKVMKNNPK